MKNREFKFRIWDDNRKRFVPLNTDADEYFEIISDGSIKYVQRKLDRYHNYTIQQYTGSKDRNGKEIYEGDIIRLFSGRIYVVEFIEENDEVESSGYMFSAFGCEILGNIFENPELLK